MSNPRSRPLPSKSPSPARNSSVLQSTRARVGRSVSQESRASTAARTTKHIPPDEEPNDMQTSRRPSNHHEDENTRLNNELEECRVFLSESKAEGLSLRQALEAARVEYQRLEDELELLKLEKEDMIEQIRGVNKSSQESQKLAESEREHLIEENRKLLKSNSELSAQLKSLRNGIQLERSLHNISTPIAEAETSKELSVPFTAALREKDREIDALRVELADIEVRLAEQTNSALLRTKQVEDALFQSKLENIRLAEDVESYQMLLRDRTLKGEYPLPGLEEYPERDEATSTRSISPQYSDRLFKKPSLASELEEADPSEDSARIKGLQTEIRHLKDSNKAMTLYINEIIGRLLRTGGFEHVLEKDVNRSVPASSTHDQAGLETTSRRTSNFDQQAPVHNRMSSESGISGGLSRAFSFRKRPETPRTIANLRPLKLVEEQQPHGDSKSETGTAPHRARVHPDEKEGDIEQRIAKRSSWVPGWFGKAGPASNDET